MKTERIIRAIIVDDEAPARRRISSFIKHHQDITISCECATGTETVTALEKFKPDIVFLDVQMPAPNGISALAESSFTPDIVIFVTAYEQYALDAFEINATDYLLKPFDKTRFDEALRRARERLGNKVVDDSDPRFNDLLTQLLETISSQQSSEKHLQRLAIRDAGEISFVDVSDIIWIESEHNYIKIHTDKENFMMRESLKSLERKLDSSRFIRIHRTAIVAIAKIKSMQPFFHGDAFVTLTNGKRLKVSRQRRLNLENALRNL